MNKEISNGMIHNYLLVNTSIVGNIHAGSDIRIDGSLQGNIECSGKIVIGEQAHIQGNIRAVNAEINGKINGNLTIQEVLTLKATSNIEGDITTQTLVIEPKAIFNGSCKMKDLKNPDKNAKQ
ncbi:MAG: polymer-forming cytoskeletal protein [Porphyromonadaceae bacterium]|nr:polymer-forming cytoskeletal protein [Porphyromonadaceae bacterium]